MVATSLLLRITTVNIEYLSDGPWSLRVHGGVRSSCEGEFPWYLLSNIFSIIFSIQWFNSDTL